MIDPLIPKKIFCGLKDIDTDKYKRDFDVTGKIKTPHDDSLNFNRTTSQGSALQLPSSSSSSSSDSEYDIGDVIADEEIRITDSGVDSEQTSITTNSELIIDVTQSAVAVDISSSSQDDITSTDSRDDIEKEKVHKMKNYFEYQTTNRQGDQTSKSDPGRLVIPEIFTKNNFSNVKKVSQSQFSLIKGSCRDGFSDVHNRTVPSISDASVRNFKSESSESSETMEPDSDDSLNIVQYAEENSVKKRKESEVGKIKNIFENMINQNQRRHSSYMSWKSSNLQLKPKPVDTDEKYLSKECLHSLSQEDTCEDKEDDYDNNKSFHNSQGHETQFNSSQINDDLERLRDTTSYRSSIISDHQNVENQRKYSSTPNLPGMQSLEASGKDSLPSGRVLELRQKFMVPVDSMKGSLQKKRLKRVTLYIFGV